MPAGKIARFVSSWGAEGTFEELALELFSYQYRHSPPYRRLCDFQGASPATVTQWDKIPAVPAEAFRSQILSCSPDPPVARFLTSGTTPGLAGSASRGAHLMDRPALDLYILSVETGFNRLASRAASLPIRALLAPAEEAPESSLSFMVSRLSGSGSRSSSRFYWQSGGPDLKAAARDLAGETQPVLLFTTAFALLELLEFLTEPVRLPEGSFVIETGGFKGRTRTVERDELYGTAMEKLGVAPDCIGSEYGMCEMASQFYDGYLGASIEPQRHRGHRAGTEEKRTENRRMDKPVKIGPPWVRTMVVDPGTGEPAAAGEPGLLRHYDLCNLNSVMALETADVGLPVEGGFILQGRLPHAPARGCSLTVEEWRAAEGGEA